NSLSAIVETLMVALIIKLLFTVITFDLKIAAGIFIPSMTIGALMGRMVGVCVQLMVEDNSTLWARCDKRGNGDESISCVVPGIYAVVGAAAAVTGVTRMTVSLTVIILELTGSVPSLLPAMTCIMLAKWVGDALAPMGLYETAIFHGGYPYLDAKRGVRQRGTKGWTVLDIVETAGIGTLGKGVSRNLGVVRSDVEYKIEELEDLVKKSFSIGRLGTRSALSARGLNSITKGNEIMEDGGFPVVDRHDVLVGYIANPELLHALNLARSSSNNEWPVIFKRPRPTASVSDRDRNLSQASLLLYPDQPILSPSFTSAPGSSHVLVGSSQETPQTTVSRAASPINQSSGARFPSTSPTPLQVPRRTLSPLVGSYFSANDSYQSFKPSATEAPYFTHQQPLLQNTPPTSAPPFLSNLIQSPTRGPVSPTFIASLPNSSRSSLARERPSQINSTITGEAHDFTPWMDTAPLAVSHTTSLDLVHELFVKLGVKTLCVVCDGKLVGVVHKKTVVAFVREVGKGMWE
ncbi:hypothetical protein DFS34DRAFT_621040, partial [Phlyctochytrium arcticum]